MEALQPLPNVARLNDYVTRILGQNPGKFTLQGTNTYLVGKGPPFILVDTGEGREEYITLLENVLRTSHEGALGVQNPPVLISDIIITHRHHDHYGGLPDVLRLLRKLHEESAPAVSEYIRPRIHKFPSPAESAESTSEKNLQSVLSSLTPESYHAASSGSPIYELKDLQKLETSDASASLQVVHTPGHTPDSICLLLRDSSDTNALGILFTADSVLGQGTAVFEDLAAYIQSLQRLLLLRDDPPVDVNYRSVYPGHGPVVDNGPELISAYVEHRLEREAQIVDVLKRTPSREADAVDGSTSSAWTIWDVVREIYKDYPENLWLPAAHGVGLHLKKLEKDGRARYIGGDGLNQRWVLSSKL